MNWSVAWSLHKRHAALKVFWELFDLLNQALFNHWLRNSVEAGVAAHEHGLVKSGGELLGEILGVCVLHIENRCSSHFLSVLSQESGAQTCQVNILLFFNNFLIVIVRTHRRMTRFRSFRCTRTVNPASWAPGRSKPGHWRIFRWNGAN